MEAGVEADGKADAHTVSLLTARSTCVDDETERDPPKRRSYLRIHYRKDERADRAILT